MDYAISEHYSHLGAPSWYGVAADPETGEYCVTAAWSALDEGSSPTSFERTQDVPPARRHVDQADALAQMRGYNEDRQAVRMYQATGTV